MKVWIINQYGNLPGENWRPHRSFMVAEAFHAKGHKVVYWISNMDHRSKFIREYGGNTEGEIIVKIVPSSIYSEHISFSRIYFEINFIKQLLILAENEFDTPDLIIIGEPALFMSFNFVKFIKKHKILFVIDMIDTWPELFNIVLPKILKPLHRLIFFPFYMKRKWFLRKASGILSVSKAYQKIAIDINSNVPSKLLYWGVDLSSFSFQPRVSNLKNTLNIIYAGTLGENYDIKSIVYCAKKIEELGLDICIFIAGDGVLRQFVLDSIADSNLKKTRYLGRIGPNELISIYETCHLALSTYSNGSTVSMPIKAFDYFAAGLPLLNSLGMDLGDLISEFDLGLNYEAGNSEDLFQKILYLYKYPDLIKIMSANCLDMSKNFDTKNIYREYVEFCERII